MKPLFIITSAIVTDVGIFEPPIRILQTLATIDSIQAKYPDAKFLLVEGGGPLDENYELWKTLRGRCHAYINLTDNDQIKQLHERYFRTSKNKNEMGGITGISKTLAETIIMITALNELQNNPELKPLTEVDRVFKISGRYQLSPLFDTAVYDDPAVKGKYVFKKRTPSWMPQAAPITGTEFGFVSRMWSFDIDQLADVIAKYDTIIADCLELTAKTYIDIEHLLYKHIGLDNTVELDYIHLFGSIAPTGTIIYD